MLLDEYLTWAAGSNDVHNDTDAVADRLRQTCAWQVTRRSMCVLLSSLTSLGAPCLRSPRRRGCVSAEVSAVNLNTVGRAGLTVQEHPLVARGALTRRGKRLAATIAYRDRREWLPGTFHPADVIVACDLRHYHVTGRGIGGRFPSRVAVHPVHRRRTSRATAAIVAMSSAGSTGLATCPWNPAASTRRRSSSRA